MNFRYSLRRLKRKDSKKNVVVNTPNELCPDSTYCGVHRSREKQHAPDQKRGRRYISIKNLKALDY